MNQRYRNLQRFRWPLIVTAVILGVIVFMWLFVAVVIGPDSARTSMESAFTPPETPKNECDGGTDGQESANIPQHTKIVVPFDGLQKLPDGIRETIGSVTAIFIESGDNNECSCGSGFVIDRDLVATAAHVIPQKEYKSLMVACNNKRVVGRVVYLDRNRDVTFISAECGERKTELDHETPGVDDPLVMSGYMFSFNSEPGCPSIVAEQFVKNTSPIPSAKITRESVDSASNELTRSVLAATLTGDIPPMSAISGAMVPGNSGSPVFRRENGIVVGMASFIDFKMNRTYVIRSVSLRQALDEYRKKKVLTGVGGAEHRKRGEEPGVGGVR